MKAAFTGILLLITLSGCSIFAPSSERELTLEVAHHRVSCMALMPTECLLVREKGTESWTYFYDEIIGFDYEPGYHYTLRVARRMIHDPPADGSSFEYRLLELLAKVPVEEANGIKSA